MALVTARQYGIDANIVHRAAQLAGRFDSLCRPEGGVGSIHRSESGSDKSGVLDRLESSGVDADTTHPQPSSSLFANHLPPGRRYNLNTDVLPTMREVCADATCGVLAIPVIPAAWEPPVAYEGSACVYVLQLYSLANVRISIFNVCILFILSL